MSKPSEREWSAVRESQDMRTSWRTYKYSAMVLIPAKKYRISRRMWWALFLFCFFLFVFKEKYGANVWGEVLQLLREHRRSFHDARTPEVLLEHWRQMRLWHLLLDQSGTPPSEKTSDFVLVERSVDVSMAGDWQLTVDECRTATALRCDERELNEWNSSQWACSRVCFPCMVFGSLVILMRRPATVF